MIDFAIAHHLLHQRHGFRCDGETKRCEARGETRHAQQAHGIFQEGGRYMPQQAFLQISRAVERIDQLAILGFGHRVDGEVAPRQILFQRHRGIGVKGEAVIAVSGLALGACECVFLVGLWMQEDREILADRAIALFQHVLGTRADHHMVVVAH